MKTSLEKLKINHPELVEEYSKMSPDELLEQICSEVLDLHAMEERVKIFMSECADGMSKTNYTIESIKTLIVEKQEQDISEYCYDLMNLPVDEIIETIHKRAEP